VYILKLQRIDEAAVASIIFFSYEFRAGNLHARELQREQAAAREFITSLQNRLGGK
jgi:hypothetical protein